MRYRFIIYALYDSRDATRTVMYVGKTKHTLENRLQKHRKNLNSGRRGPWMAQVIQEGAEVLGFALEVIESDDERAWRDPERSWVDKYQMINPGLLNDRPGGTGAGEISDSCRENIRKAHLGKKASLETRAKMRASANRPEHIAKMRALHIGKIMSPETRAKISVALLGKKISPQQRENMRIAQNRPEVKEKLRAIRTGSKRTAETKARMSAALLGRRFSSEHRSKISKTLTGRKLSKETCAKMSASRLGKSRPYRRAQAVAFISSK